MKTLKGVVIGFVFGLAASSFAAQLLGDTGYLMGWEVRVGGERVCSDPFVWPGLKEIECH